MSRRLLELDGSNLSLAAVNDFERARPKVRLGETARIAMTQSVTALKRAIAGGQVCYGVNTGFGAFANRRISPDQITKLQYNLVRSHACGLGDPLPGPIVRRILLLKANSLASGHSGIRPEVVDTLLGLLNADVLPVIPSRGSVGASGDLAPLAHLALALIGEGEALHAGQQLANEAVLAAAGCEPVSLGAKEGLALLNGTQVSAALALEGLFRAECLLESSVVVGALSVEGLAGSHRPFDARIQEVRRMHGQCRIAEQLRSLLKDSDIKRSHENCERVQDPYAVRCMPQVLGAVRDTLRHAASVLNRECNAVSDNPLVFGDDVISGGNFHAEPIAFVSDFLAIAVAETGNMSERRIDLLERQVNPNLSLFLTSEPGLECGFMIAHVASAALASENKTLAHPASVDSIPTSAGQEDHVSMAIWAGIKLLHICDNCARILAIELLAAARAIEQQRPLHSSDELERVVELLREKIPFEPQDHRLDREIELITVMINEGRFAELLPLRCPLSDEVSTDRQPRASET